MRPLGRRLALFQKQNKGQDRSSAQKITHTHKGKGADNLGGVFGKDKIYPPDDGGHQEEDVAQDSDLFSCVHFLPRLAFNLSSSL